MQLCFNVSDFRLPSKLHQGFHPIVIFAYDINLVLLKQINNTFLVDINQQAPAAAQASSNIIRCALSALAVAILEDIINGIGIGWTFTLLGIFLLVPIGLNLLLRKKGMAWRLRMRDSASGASADTEAGDSGLKLQETSITLQSCENAAAT